MSDSSETAAEFDNISGFLVTGREGFKKPLLGSLLGKRDFFFEFFLFSLFLSLSILASD